MILTQALARLLAESPSIRAAMKAGRKTRISCRVYRANLDRWDDIGTVGQREGKWGEWLIRFARAKVVIRFRYKGKEIERSTY